MKILAITLFGTALLGGVVAQQAPVDERPARTAAATVEEPEPVARMFRFLGQASGPGSAASEPAAVGQTQPAPANAWTDRFPGQSFTVQPPRAPQAPRAVGLAESPRLPGVTWTRPASANSFFRLSTRSSKELSAASRKVDDATRKLSAASGDDIADAEAALEDALTELFDQKTAVREKQIADLEKQLATLRDQLDQRIDQKARIVRLRLQTLKNEANGLTF